MEFYNFCIDFFPYVSNESTVLDQPQYEKLASVFYLNYNIDQFGALDAVSFR